MCYCSVIVEALKMDSLQRLCSSLEPILRRVVSLIRIVYMSFGALCCFFGLLICFVSIVKQVSEEVERALAKLGPARLSER